MINLHLGDSLEIAKTLETGSVQTIVTSPPYWGLRDYGVAGQLGLERTPEEYVCHLVELFRELRRVLRDDGTLWLNLGDSYAGSWGSMSHDLSGAAKRAGMNGRPVTTNVNGLKSKDLVGIPWRVAFALQADGWYLRSDIIWHKPNPMPESVTDRPTKAHEYIFLLSKSSKYYYDADAVRERATSDFGKGKTDAVQKYSHMKRNIAHSGWLGGDGETRNKRSVWTVTTKPFKGAHFATFPKDLIAPCILAGAPVGGVVLDPFTGSGTTGLVSVELGRSFVGMELNPEYHAMAEARIATAQAPLPYAVNVL
jgi:DNA modification methylase